MPNEEYEVTVLDKEDQPIITEEECRSLKPIMVDFVKTYIKNRKSPVETWLPDKMHEYLPEKSRDEIVNMSDEIITAVRVSDEKKASLEKAISNGRSKESWFASEMKKTTSAMSAQEAAKYLQNLDNAVNAANEAMYKTIMTKSGNINMNPNLDGFIAEQYHVNSFNMDAAVKGSNLHAKVLDPKPGQTYTKNGFDAVMENSSNQRIHQYQAKYGKTAEETIKLLKSGDYRNQTFLVPADQVAEVQKAFPNKTVTAVLSEGNVSSTELTKQEAKILQEEAQSGNWKELNWNEYKTKDLAKGIGKQAGHAALLGAAVGVGFDIARKLWRGEEIKGEEVVETAITSGADSGIKVAVSGALTVGCKKGILKFIPQGTAPAIITNIAVVAVENVKVLGKVAKGELTIKEGLEKMGQTTVSTVAGLATSAVVGAGVGSAVGTVLGPAGTIIGGFVGGAVGYMAGSKVGEAVWNGAKKVGTKIVETAKSIGSTAKAAATKLATGAKNFVSNLGKMIFG